ncbi:MAG: hypothetical protein P4L95_17870 [Rouxiella aceris]|nr:hypothetical protein [Rouxiella aceris]MDR3433743.1 hypothetical protein [Rouxiella aceris]
MQQKVMPITLDGRSQLSPGGKFGIPSACGLEDEGDNPKGVSLRLTRR